MLLTKASALFSFPLAILAAGSVFQTPLSTDTDGLFTPLESLSFLTHQYTALRHPRLSDFRVRIKKTEGLCDDNVKAYTGYVDAGTSHTFFYFFESQDDPVKDDIIFWINGGLGCSASVGLLMDLGPCTLASSFGTKPNPHSLNAHANVFFIDNGANVGFSYNEDEDYYIFSEPSFGDFAVLMAFFIANFPSFQGSPVYLAGESIGGRRVPYLAYEVGVMNMVLEREGLPKVNLQGVIIGNGLVDFYNLIDSYHTMVCTNASMAPVLDPVSCEKMKQSVPLCKEWLERDCLVNYNCTAAFSFCNEEIAMPLIRAKINPYDISRSCNIYKLSESACYPIINSKINTYLSRPEIQYLLGVDPGVDFSSYILSASPFFSINHDEYMTTGKENIEALISNGLKVLIYVGNLDWRSNWVGNEAVTADPELSDNEETPELRIWEVDGKKAGLTRSDGRVTFVTVEGAGHFIPHDKPREVAVMIEHWLKGEKI